MVLLRYKDKVIGNTTYEKALQYVIGAAREMEQISRLKIYKDPKARKSFWHDHADLDGPGGRTKVAGETIGRTIF